MPLIEVNEFLQSGFIEDEQLIYEESLFNRLNSLANVLFIFNNINKPIQRDFLPYSEFYLMWEFAKENLIDINNMLSKIFAQSMHFREENIIQNNLCVWALFIDLRSKKERVVYNCLDIREQLYTFYLSIDKLKRISCDAKTEGTKERI